MTEKKTKKRITLPKKTNQVLSTEVTVVPSLGSLVDDALAIIGSELAQYRSKTKKGITLDLKEARVVTGYLDALTKASKEAREQARADDLSDLSNEELLQLAMEMTKSKSETPKLANPPKSDSDNSED